MSADHVVTEAAGKADGYRTVTLSPCLLCRVSGPGDLVSRTLRDDTSGRFEVVRCLTCGHTQLSPVPSEEEESQFYETDQQTLRLMGQVDLELWRRKGAEDTARRLEWTRSVVPAGSAVLDVGCGWGRVS